MASVTGTATVGAEVTAYLRDYVHENQLVDSDVADGSGNWSVSLLANAADTDYLIVVYNQDAETDRYSVIVPAGAGPFVATSILGTARPDNPAPIPPITGPDLTAALAPYATTAAVASGYSAKGAFWVNVKDFGATGDGVTDDTAAINAVFAALDGTGAGGTVYFPKGLYKVETVTSGVILSLSGKNNISIVGGGTGAIIRTSSATATELMRIENCNLLRMSNIRFDVRGTAQITNGVHYTTTSPGSAHSANFDKMYVSGVSAFRKVYDVSTVSGSPTIYSAMAAFGAGDVNGVVLLNFQSGPVFATINSVATLSGTLSAGINSSVTSITLNSIITGAPASGFTIQVDSERMLVTAGGNTTTLTVARGRGNANAAASHSSGAAVTSYSATLSANASATVSNGTLAGRIQASGLSVLQNAYAVGIDHPGASNLDIANVVFNHCVASRAARAGFAMGNGTAANILDHHAYGISASECGYGVYMSGGQLSIHGGEMSTNLVDFKRNVTVTQDMVIDGVRSEGAAIFWEHTGAQTQGSSVRLSSIEVASSNAEDGIVIRHLTSAPLLLENVSLTLNPLTALGPGVFIAAVGTSTNPCHVTAINVSSAGGNSSLFTGGLPSTIRTILSQPRLSSGSYTQNTVYGTLFDDRVSLQGGLVRGRTAVANTNYTVLTTDSVIAYTSISAARVVTLPSVSTVTNQEFIIKDESGSCSVVNTITITPASGTIDGAATLVLNAAYAKAVIYSNGTNWFTR